MANSDLCDVTFYVGVWKHKDKPVVKEELEKIPAHKLILSITSTVFRAMFSGNWSEQKEVIVTDFDVSTFRNMLR